MTRSVLHVEQVLTWADDHLSRTGKWPRKDGGKVFLAPDEKWENLDMALRKGLRGFPGGWSLPQLLEEYRGARNHKRLPRLTVKKILAWADAFYLLDGTWPCVLSGPITGTKGDTWRGVNQALFQGHRGLPGGSSLAQLLSKHRGARNIRRLPRLSVKRLLVWADAHYRRTRRWPVRTSGQVKESPGDTWSTIDKALRRGSRGLRTQSSLFGILKKHRGVSKLLYRPPLTTALLLKWATAYRRRTGKWPSALSGLVFEDSRERWCNINIALRKGYRGLPAGGTLSQLFRAAPSGKP